MAYEELQAVVGTAVIDSGFRKALLNGGRRRVISDFDLTHEEVDMVMGIRAESLEQFAGELDQWILRSSGRHEPPPLALPRAASIARAPLPYC